MNTTFQINYAGHIGTLAAWLIGLTFLCVLLGGGLHLLGHRLRWFHVREDGPNWFVGITALFTLGLCLLIGAWTGLKVGGLRAMSQAAEEAGPALMRSGIEATLKTAGMTNVQSVDVARLRELLDQFDKAPLPPMDFPKAESLRTKIEELRTKVSPRLRELLDKFAPGEKISVDDLVNRTWAQIHTEMVKWVRAFTQIEILEGLALVLLVEVLAAMGCWTIRKLLPKPAATTPTKLV